MKVAYKAKTNFESRRCEDFFAIKLNILDAKTISEARPMMNFDDMVKVILERGKVSRDELMSKIRQKQDELSGFITSEGAAIIVGRELGVENYTR